MPVKTLTKNVPKTSSAPNATAKFAEASATLTFDRILDDIQWSTMVQSKRETQKTGNDSNSWQVVSEQFTSDITVVAGPKPSSVALHNAIDQVDTFVHSQIESLAIRRGASKGSDARLHERHANISPENERLCPTHVVDNTSEAVPPSMQMEPCESLAFEHAMGSTWTLKNSHHTCDDELEARAVTEDSTNCGGELDWHIEGLTCSGVEAIFRDFNADTNDEDIKGERAT